MIDAFLLYVVFIFTLAIGAALVTGWLVEWYLRRYRR